MTPAAQTETIVNRLIDEISSFADERLWTTDIALHFERKARKLREVNIGEGDMLLGIIHSIDGDIKAMRKAFTNAVAFLPNNDDVKENFAVGLYRNGFFTEALQILLEVEQRKKTHGIYDLLTCVCLALGLTAKAKQYFCLAGRDEKDFEKAKEKPVPVSALQEKAVSLITQSMRKDAAVWASLSKR